MSGPVEGGVSLAWSTAGLVRGGLMLTYATSTAGAAQGLASGHHSVGPGDLLLLGQRLQRVDNRDLVLPKSASRNIRLHCATFHFQHVPLAGHYDAMGIDQLYWVETRDVTRWPENRKFNVFHLQPDASSVYLGAPCQPSSIGGEIHRTGAVMCGYLYYRSVTLFIFGRLDGWFCRGVNVVRSGLPLTKHRLPGRGCWPLARRRFSQVLSAT